MQDIDNLWDADTKAMSTEQLEQHLIDLEDDHAVQKARDNINDFIEYVIFDKETKKPIKQGDIHRLIQKSITEYRKLMFGIPREHGKSTQIIGRVLWDLGHNHDLRIKIVGASDALARKRVLALRNTIESNKRYHKVFPDVKPSKFNWGTTSFTIEREVVDHNPTVEGSGVLSAGTGDRADWIIFDDPCDNKNSIIDVNTRPKVFEAIVNVWLNLLSPSSRYIWIFTPWHTQDAAAIFKKDNMCEVIERYVDDALTPVWPERWGKQMLLERLHAIKQRAFDKGFKGRALSDDERLFVNIEANRNYDLSFKDVEETDGVYTLCGVDLALSKNERAAYTVIFGLKVDSKGHKAPVNILRKKIGSTATAAWILALWEKYGYNTIVVETNAYQQALEDWIEFFHSTLKNYCTTVKINGKLVVQVDKKKFDTMYTDILSKDITPEEWYEMKPYLYKGASKFPYVVSFVTGKQKADEIIGIPGFAADIVSGNWVFPSKGCHASCVCPICAWITEMNDYPIGATKDIIMAAWFANSAIRGMSLEIKEI